MDSNQFGRIGMATTGIGGSSLCNKPVSETVASVLADCTMAMANIEGLLKRIDIKLFGDHPEAPCDLSKAEVEPPIETRCLTLRARLRATVQFAESLSDKL